MVKPLTVFFITAVTMSGLWSMFAKSRVPSDESRQRSRGMPLLRDAGPESMISPPPKWEGVDEASDQSFPASDPPATY